MEYKRIPLEDFKTVFVEQIGSYDHAQVLDWLITEDRVV